MNRISGISLALASLLVVSFSAAAVPTQVNLPDGGVTAGLLGLGVVGLALARKFIR